MRSCTAHHIMLAPRLILKRANSHTSFASYVAARMRHRCVTCAQHSPTEPDACGLALLITSCHCSWMSTSATHWLASSRPRFPRSLWPLRRRRGWSSPRADARCAIHLRGSLAESRDVAGQTPPRRSDRLVPLWPMWVHTTARCASPFARSLHAHTPCPAWPRHRSSLPPLGECARARCCDPGVALHCATTSPLGRPFERRVHHSLTARSTSAASTHAAVFWVSSKPSSRPVGALSTFFAPPRRSPVVACGPCGRRGLADRWPIGKTVGWNCVDGASADTLRQRRALMGSSAPSLAASQERSMDPPESCAKVRACGVGRRRTNPAQGDRPQGDSWIAPHISTTAASPSSAWCGMCCTSFGLGRRCALLSKASAAYVQAGPRCRSAARAKLVSLRASAPPAFAIGASGPCVRRCASGASLRVGPLRPAPRGHFVRVWSGRCRVAPGEYRRRCAPPRRCSMPWLAPYAGPGVPRLVSPVGCLVCSGASHIEGCSFGSPVGGPCLDAASTDMPRQGQALVGSLHSTCLVASEVGGNRRPEAAQWSVPVGGEPPLD